MSDRWHLTAREICLHLYAGWTGPEYDEPPETHDGPYTIEGGTPFAARQAEYTIEVDQDDDTIAVDLHASVREPASGDALAVLRGLRAAVQRLAETLDAAIEADIEGDR